MHYRPADGVCAGLLKEPQTGPASGERGPISAAQKGHGRDCRGWEVRSSSRRDCKEEEGAGQSFVSERSEKCSHTASQVKGRIK